MNRPVIKLRDQAYDAVARHLVDRNLVPGQFVTQRELAALTAMSLGAIREMIPRLEAEGLIRAISQRGLQIVHVDMKLVAEAFQLREIFELAGVEAFCRHAPDDDIQALVDRFRVIKEKAMHGPATPALLQEAQAADWDMHDVFVAALHNELIANQHRVNSIRIRMILGERIGLPAERLPVALQEHEAVLRAVQRRDHQAATQALRAHLRSSRQRSLSVGPFDENTTIAPAGLQDKE